MDPATEATDAWWRQRANDVGSALQDASLLRAAAPALELVVAYLASNAIALLDDALERLPAVAQKVSETNQLFIHVNVIATQTLSFGLVTSPWAVSAVQSRSIRAPARNATHAEPASQAATPVILSLRENARDLVSDVLRDVMWPTGKTTLVVTHAKSTGHPILSVCALRSQSW
jgi:hypothetical protein